MDTNAIISILAVGLSFVFVIAFMNMFSKREDGRASTAEEDGSSDIRKQNGNVKAGREGVSHVGIFVAIVMGIVVAVWIISKIFYLDINGTITLTK